MSDPTHRFTHQAMATEWEFQLVHADPHHAESSSRRLIECIDRLEDELSRFRTGSYIRQIALLEPGERLEVSRSTFDCLELAMAVHAETGGAFDITVAELYRGVRQDWRSRMEHLHLDPEELTVWTTWPGLTLDLGAIGKGHALDELVPILQEQEIEEALLNAGESTILALGRNWPINLGPETIAIRDCAISGSGFEVKGLHIFDPRIGAPLQTDRLRAWVISDCAALSDALSTASLMMEEEELAALAAKYPDISVIIPEVAKPGGA